MMLMALGLATMLITNEEIPLNLFRGGDVVLFQGDSITDGNRGRSEDPNHILGHGYVFSIASKYGGTYPTSGLTFLNRGISGNTLADLEARWKEDTIALKPTVLSIMVGINDVHQYLVTGKELDFQDIESRYDALLTNTQKALPDIRLVLCEPFTIDTGDPAVYLKRRSAVKKLDEIVQRLATKHKAAFVPCQRAFDDAAKLATPKHWVWDGIHPTYSGHLVLAKAWEAAYRKRFVDPLEDPMQNSAIAPEVNSERDSYDWLHRHRDIIDYPTKVNPEIVLIGDSITHFWGGDPSTGQKNGPKTWSKTFSTIPVMNMGCGWDRTQNVLWRLQHGELVGVNPRWVVLNIGTNNLVGDETARTNSPEEIAVGIRKIAELLRDRCPQAKLLVMGVFPRGDEPGNPLDRDIARLNEILKAQFRTSPNTLFCDLRTELGNREGGVKKGLFSDGTHPNENGYQVWGSALERLGIVAQRG